MVMRDLIAKIEKLDGPSYAVDTAVALLTGFWPAERIEKTVNDPDHGFTVWFTDGPEMQLPPPVTASLDAAVTLAERVLPGWWWLKPDWNIMSVYRHGDGDAESVEYSATHHVNAIALVLATLKAKEAQDG